MVKITCEGNFSISQKDRIRIKAYISAKQYAVLPTPVKPGPQLGRPKPSTLEYLRRAKRKKLKFVTLQTERIGEDKFEVECKSEEGYMLDDHE